MIDVVENAESIDMVLKRVFGANSQIAHRQRVGGGDINDSAVLQLADGRRVFLKENRANLVSMFACEVAGLLELRRATDRGGPPVPTPLGWGADSQRSFLLMEYLPSGHLDSGAGFGRLLAALHRNRRRSQSGFDSDNWIGSTPQPNGSMEGWHEFFAERRLGFQWAMARNGGYGDSSADRDMESILSRLKELLPLIDDGQASLLHGDLWGGNWMAGADGRGWLIDPAVYYGHREADLAMTELFGGFPAGFLKGYQEAWPLEPGFSERCDLYNLYHLLNHVNLFGSSYWGGVRRILRRYA